MASSMPVPVSPRVGPGLIGGPPGEPLMLMTPPTAWAIISKARLLSNGLPSPEFCRNLTASAVHRTIARFAPLPSNRCNRRGWRSHRPWQPQRGAGEQEAAAVVGSEPIGELGKPEQFAEIDAGFE